MINITYNWRKLNPTTQSYATLIMKIHYIVHKYEINIKVNVSLDFEFSILTFS